MARRITSFDEYDAGKVARKVKAAEFVDNMLRTETDKAKHNLERICAVEGARIGDAMKSSLVGLDYMESELHSISQRLTGTAQNIEHAIRRKVNDAGSKEYFLISVKELISCAVHVSKHNQDRILDEHQRNETYARFVAAFNELAYYNPGVMEKFPDYSKVIRFPFLPTIPEKVSEFKSFINSLRKGKYLHDKSDDVLLDLLYPVKSKKDGEVYVEKIEGAVVFVPNRPDDAQARSGMIAAAVEYLVENFKIDDAVASKIAEGENLDSLTQFYHDISDMVGEDDAKRIVADNPDLLQYQNGSRMKYLTTLNDVCGEVKRNLGKNPEVVSNFGIEGNVSSYSDLEKLIGFKQRLFGITRQFSDGADVGITRERTVDVEDYMKKLLRKANLDVALVRALTTGTNLNFIGEVYMPAEYFRKNVGGKVAQGLMSDFQDTFDRMVKLGAITRKHKLNPLYRFNPKMDEISDKYLREYMRIILHRDQIVAQEGRLTFNEDLVQELYGNGAPKKPL